MKSFVKYLGLIIIAAVLLINFNMIRNLSEQNDRIETKIMRLAQLVNDTASNKTYQSSQSQPKIQKEVMTPLDLANYLGIDMDKVYAMVENKETKIPYINIDGEYKFSKAAIDEWMKTSGQVNTGK